MFPVSSTLLLTAMSLGAGHALLGPDHSIPFVAMSLDNRWSLPKALRVTLLCGLGHIMSSVLIGFIGIGLNWKLSRAFSVESVRGGLAGWALMSFGFIYLIWGLKKAYAARHPEIVGAKSASSWKTWMFFLVFIFGPCEPLIPLVMYPAAHQSAAALMIVTLVFGAATISTMMAIVALALKGARIIPVRRMERFAPAMAGVIIILCGAAVQFLKL